MAKIIINDAEIQIRPGETIFTHADGHQSVLEEIASSCHRNGTCRECIVEIKSGMESLSPVTPKETFLQTLNIDDTPGTFRLSCQAVVEKDDTDIVCETFKRSLQIVQKGRDYPVNLNPMTTQNNGKVYFNGTEIDSYQGHLYGIAMDLGTTTVVMNLMDLETGELVFSSSFENPQKYGGSDVLHRISYNNDEQKKGQLHETIISFVNKEIRAMPVNRRQIYEMVIAGNATMRDICFRLDVETIGVSPYKSLTQYDFEAGKIDTTAIYATAKDLRLAIHPNAMIYGIPIVGCHVGADTAAAALTLDLLQQDEPVMLIDIGTNTEVILGNKDRIIAASCPAGPAFEGGKIKYGMTGIDGAIERIFIHDQHVEYHVIGDLKPKGICGSGLIDLLAELLKSGKMDEMGRFADGSHIFTVVPERHITFSRADMSELAQAKSANIAGQKILMRKYGVSMDQINKFYLAGGFAWYINPQNAVDIGLIPPFPIDKIVKLGNASLEGAKAVLMSRDKRTEVEALVKRIEHIELEQEPDFFDIFVEGAQFKPLDS